MIAIVDYGMGNLRNVRRALTELGFEGVITDKAAEIATAEKVILPGVGAFGEAVKRIDGLGLRSAIMDRVHAGVPMIGICLGMQLLCEESEESPGYKGLGILQSTVKRFPDTVLVPHIGWNDVVPVNGGAPLFTDETQTFYFVHSYYVPKSEAAIGITDYGLEYAAAVRKGNVFGVQFHPEKSQGAGLALLKRFLAQTPLLR